MTNSNIQELSLQELESLQGGGRWSVACGAGIALSTLTGSIGLILYGPATVGICAAAFKLE